MSSDAIEPQYRRGTFPKFGIHMLITSRIKRLRPEVPSTRLERLGAKIVDGDINLTHLWIATGVTFLLAVATLGILTVVFLPVAVFAGVAAFSKRLWGRRGDPNRPDRLVIYANDVERFMSDYTGSESVMVYAEALHAVMGVTLQSEEYEELSSMLKNLLQAELEAKSRRSTLQRDLEKLTGHDPKRPLEEKREELRRTTNLATRQVLEQSISVLEQQHLRREHLRNNIAQLAAQEDLAIELMRSMGESTVQLDTNPYVAISPILESARKLVYAMDHEVLAVERAIVEMEVAPVRIAIQTEQLDISY